MLEDLSDEELVLTDSECASPVWPTLPVGIPVSKPVEMRRGHSAADTRNLISDTASLPGRSPKLQQSCLTDLMLLLKSSG